MTDKPGFKSGYVILQSCRGVRAPTAEMVSQLKKEKDPLCRKALYGQLHGLLSQERVREILIFKELLYSVIKLFHMDNKGNGAAFLSEREIDPAEAFRRKFVEPLPASLEQPSARNTVGCIECGKAASSKLAQPLPTAAQEYA